MIYLYSGTPGSGKSLDVARLIYFTLMRNKPVICNFDINKQRVKHPDKFVLRDNVQMTPDFLTAYSQDYFNGKPMKEGEITVIIDEAQMLFNARSWDAKGREKWNKFFQVHRHYGYDIILVAQFDRMIDRQIRSLIEYEVVHRKVSNFGWKGKLLCTLMVAPHLFVKKKVWYPMKESIGCEYFRMRKRYYRLYDTYAVFTADTET